jgi:hypothetical protein
MMKAMLSGSRHGSSYATSRFQVDQTRSSTIPLERKITDKDQLRRIDIRAPQSGVVHEMAAHTVGGVISAGEPIMMIVPEADALEVETRVTPRHRPSAFRPEDSTALPGRQPAHHARDRRRDKLRLGRPLHRHPQRRSTRPASPSRLTACPGSATCTSFRAFRSRASCRLPSGPSPPI